LCGADILGSDLRRTDLRGADLRGANLDNANLSWWRTYKPLIQLWIQLHPAKQPTEVQP
jgi:uncharacterized protein YjbI with pentapeptide repeats